MSTWMGSLVKVTLIISFLLILNCAKMGAPPGGPEDKTAPSVLSVYPESNSTKVVKDNVISIEFSEKMDRESIADAIFITPRIEGEIKYKWKKNRLNIILPDSFLDSLISASPIWI